MSTHPFDLLLAAAKHEISDYVRDDLPAEIQFHPGKNGNCSYLFWRPIGEHDEVQIWEFDPQAKPKHQIKNLSLMGNEVAALRQFIDKP